jgi:phospholipid/cholesterol/gamma-HCH transport system substrate-binding protein
MGFLIAEEGGGMEDLLADAGEVLKDVKAMSSAFRDVFAPDEKDNPMKKIVDNLEALTANLNDAVSGNKDKLASLIDNLEKMSQSLADETSREIDDSSLNKLREILTSTEKLTDDLQLLVQDVRQGKGTIGKLLVEDEIADEVRQTLAGVQKIVSRVDALRSEIVVFTGANTRSGGKTEAYMKIFPSPERYYLLGVSTSKFGPESETIKTTINNGNETTRIEKEQDKDTYRFNLQLGRRVHHWGFRGGLIESSGGIGVDYYIPKYGMRLSSEVFDYRKDIGVNIRLAAEFQLWNVLYGKISGDDLAEETRSGTISAGLRFTDEDLKGLIGLFL